MILSVGVESWLVVSCGMRGRKGNGMRVIIRMTDGIVILIRLIG